VISCTLVTARSAGRTSASPTRAILPSRFQSKVRPSTAPANTTRRDESSSVLLQLAEGRSNQQIGERLFISPRTVESHVESLMRKCSTGTRAELVAFAGAAARGLGGEATA
jgi:DNA-binding NarL/FixJ family response regulator